MKLTIICTLLSIINSTPLAVLNSIISSIPSNPLTPTLENILEDPFAIFNQPAVTTTPTPTATPTGANATVVTPTPTAAAEVLYVSPDPIYGGDTIAAPYDSMYVGSVEPIYGQAPPAIDYVDNSNNGQGTIYTDNNQPNSQYNGVSVEEQALNYSSQFYDSDYNLNHGYA
ncbi:hypothetical protein CONCODRAFT_72567 [Conidiobolus coronatus NRRL 28638]|uniref:Uncharacterized protein n=1 Tax=Conidiobolus coronatus (strain ATCC 28846 / CBS 209.66 / NRRL 28638) TaxID=796925 RepID=A0A137NYZ7_CONC2|nr:hypothetical protein CONCODRAFT_72567 [Conidiobolus coronatus NRRL 28638]|eukprot:KXN68016.1 hypothetical protein CONCODRAFT_72567 [Conidiobolus coronatus NRRL 28638]